MLSRKFRKYKKIEDRTCDICRAVYTPIVENQKVCSDACRKLTRHRSQEGITCSTSSLGASGELVVAADLLLKGWSVFRSLSPACFCDLVAIKDGVIRFIEVRTGQYKRGIVCDQIIFSKVTKPGVTEFAVYILQNKTIHYFPVA